MIQTDANNAPTSPCERRQAAGHLLETYGGAPGTEDPLLPSYLSATFATAIPEAIAATGHSRDADHGDCARMLRKAGARGTPDGWQAVPVRRRVGALCGKLGIDPTDLSLLGGQAGVPT